MENNNPSNPEIIFIKRGHCPVCEHPLNAVIGENHNEQPNPGDISICVSCKSFSIFDESLNLKLPNSDQFREIQCNAELQKIIKKYEDKGN